MHRLSPRSLVTLVLLLFVTRPASTQPSYLDHDALGRRLAAIARDHRERVAVRSIAATRQGRDLWLVTIGGTGADDRPAVLVVGGLDGSSRAGTELALRLVERLASDPSDSARALLARTTYYVVASASPDALAAATDRPRYERDRNTTPYDDDRDGSLDEDGPDDLDGDGIIAQMRVRSAAGRYIADPDDTRFVRQADAARGERGTYELLVEGRDDDGDGAFNEDAPGGVDVNRNFPFAYRQFAGAAGEHPVSEIETRALADFCYDHQNIALVFSFAGQSNLLHPWETKPDAGPNKRILRSVREPDQAPLARLAKLYAEQTGMKGGRPYEEGEGAFSEWAYYHYGRFSVAAPGWSTDLARPIAGDSAGAAARPAHADTLAWLERYGVRDGFVAWKRVTHPDFEGREVEVGGMAPFATSEPPAALLDSLGRAHADYLVRLGGLLPRIELAELRTEPLGDGLTRIRAIVANTGYLPTLSAIGEISEVPLDVKAELTLGSGQAVVTGRRVRLLGPIAGNGGSRELTWVIAGRGAVRLRIAGPMAGGIERSVELGR